jgi:ACR3 family arsenite efflux pump ArsB
MDLPQLLERRQVPLYLAAIAAGVLLGAALPRTGPLLEVAVEPAIAALLLVTFHGIPLTRLGESLADRRFLLTLLGVNFLVVPAVVWVLTRPLADSPELLAGVLLVLLAPCVDYVVVFTGLVRGAHEKLLAATPLLMLAQVLALPVLVPLLGGGAAADLLDPGPFVRALVLLVLAPLLLAALLQRLAPRLVLAPAIVPLMLVVLLTVTASQTPRALGAGAALAALVPLYAAFLVLMVVLGLLLARLARLDLASARAVALSGATRNSLVVLPLALAMPSPLAPAAVVAQTLVELVGMVVLVRVLPRLRPLQDITEH